MKAALILLVIVVMLLHQDFWNWKDRTLVFGFLPVGLAYHAGYAIVASLTMALLVRYLWPRELEEEVEALQGEKSTPSEEAAAA
jgi:hypothetical protein